MNPIEGSLHTAVGCLIVLEDWVNAEVTHLMPNEEAWRSVFWKTWRRWKRCVKRFSAGCTPQHLEVKSPLAKLASGELQEARLTGTHHPLRKPGAGGAVITASEL